MMSKDIVKQIKELAPWYQRINLNGVMTINKDDHYFNVKAGEHTWNVIKKQFLPDSLSNMRILDLGCNAGFYSVSSSLLEAKEVIGVELGRNFFKQALFIKDFFEKYSKKKLNIKYINADIGDLDLDNLGDFDYIFAIAIIYHIGKHKYGKYTKEALKEQKDVIKRLSFHTKKFIIRCRNGKNNSREYYKNMFEENGFVESKFIPQGKRGMILYESRS
jgi:2-polyprenyl-3-methyl-5-hydroxy-6-metoxy-1,4-benzoquinol methylase